MSHIRRREFITLLGGAAAAWPLAARAQQPAMPVIGFLHTQHRLTRRRIVCAHSPGPQGYWLCRGRERGDRIPLGRQSTRTVADAGGRTGSPAGRGDHRDRRSRCRCSRPRRRLRRSRSSLSSATTRSSSVSSRASPGRAATCTGVNFFAEELATKRLELLHELVPAAARVAVLVNPTSPRCRVYIRDVEAAARTIGLQIQVLNASTSREIDAAFATLVRKRPDALLVGTGPFFTGRRAQLVQLAARHGVPAIYAGSSNAEIGGLMSYGASLTDAYRQVGVYASRILKGAKPADLPVVQSTKFELVINAQTARMLGLAIRRRCSPAPTR